MRLHNLTVPSLFALIILLGCASNTDVTVRQPYIGEKIDRPDRIIAHELFTA
jgi:hypothetical protein